MGSCEDGMVISLDVTSSAPVIDDKLVSASVANAIVFMMMIEAVWVVCDAFL